MAPITGRGLRGLQLEEQLSAAKQMTHWFRCAGELCGRGRWWNMRLFLRKNVKKRKHAIMLKYNEMHGPHIPPVVMVMIKMASDTTCCDTISIVEFGAWNWSKTTPIRPQIEWQETGIVCGKHTINNTLKTKQHERWVKKTQRGRFFIWSPKSGKQKKEHYLGGGKLIGECALLGRIVSYSRSRIDPSNFRRDGWKAPLKNVGVAHWLRWLRVTIYFSVWLWQKPPSQKNAHRHLTKHRSSTITLLWSRWLIRGEFIWGEFALFEADVTWNQPVQHEGKKNIPTNMCSTAVA